MQPGSIAARSDPGTCLFRPRHAAPRAPGRIRGTRGRARRGDAATGAARRDTLTVRAPRPG